MDLLTIFFLLASLFTSIDSITFSPPNGPFNVEMTVHSVTDTSALDPYSERPERRSLMVTIFNPPNKNNPCIPVSKRYMPAAVAAYYDDQFSAYGIPNGTFASINMAAHIPVKKGVVPSCHPTILFSPGLGNSRLIYSNTASALAAQGFNVITIDRPHDSPVVVFPVGSVTTAANITSDGGIEKAFEVRSDETIFLASQDPLLTARSSSRGCSGTRPVFASGHSLGGAAAVDSVRRFEVLKASVNLDGSLWGAEMDNTTALLDPVLLLRSERNQTIPSWQRAWPRVSGPKVELELKNARHGTFTDFPLLIDALGLGDALGNAVSGTLGTIDGGDALRALVGVLTAWFGEAASKSCRSAVEEVVSAVEGNADLAVIRY